MTSICMYFQVHQPMRLRHFSVFGEHAERLDERYFDCDLNRRILEKVANKCYLPTNELLLRLIEDNHGSFKISYSLSGSFLEQAKRFCPQLIESFQRLAKTGCVEFLDETYYHSLASLFTDKREFAEQVRLHADALKELFGARASTFRNTEVIFSNDIARLAEGMGYSAIMTEGLESLLGWRSPNYVYSVAGTDGMRALLRNFKLSDDVSYRFSARWWSEWPLTADKYARWLAASEGQCINLFMDYETFGEHQWSETGIFSFLEHFPREALKYQHLEFQTPAEVVRDNEPVGEVSAENPVSWADIERDTSAWLGNDMQRECFHFLQDIGTRVRSRGDDEMLHSWRLLQNSDHLYYLCTKSLADGDVHKYFSPFESPYDGFINYMNILQDFSQKADEA